MYTLCDMKWNKFEASKAKVKFQMINLFDQKYFQFTKYWQSE